MCKHTPYKHTPMTTIIGTNIQCGEKKVEKHERTNTFTPYYMPQFRKFHTHFAYILRMSWDRECKMRLNVSIYVMYLCFSLNKHLLHIICVKFVAHTHTHTTHWQPLLLFTKWSEVEYIELQEKGRSKIDNQILYVLAQKSSRFQVDYLITCLRFYNKQTHKCCMESSTLWYIQSSV